MKRLVALFPLVCAGAVLCFAQVQSPENTGFEKEGTASWYGEEFQGRQTASNELFDPKQYTAAHPTLPFGTVLLITNTANQKQVQVRVNDRGPFVRSRIIDVSKAAAEKLDMLGTGTAQVTLEVVSAQAPTPSNAGQRVAPVLTVIETPSEVIVRESMQPVEQETARTLPPTPTARTPASAQRPSAPQAAVTAAPAEPRLPQQMTPAYTPQLPQAATPQRPAALPPVPPPASAPATPPPAARQTVPATPQPASRPTVPAPAQTAAPQQYTPSAPAAPAVPAPKPPAAETATQQNQLPASTVLGGPIIPGRVYRIQVGSFKEASNAMKTYNRLISAGFNPQWERHEGYFRVVLTGVHTEDIPVVAARLGSAGFSEVVARLEGVDTVP